MAAHDPIDPRVRLVISQWSEDAPRGAVSTSGTEHGIFRKSFCELLRRARPHGPAAVLEPRSRRPARSPSRLTEDVKDQAVAVRAALEACGLDHGPISVHDEMTSMGLPVVPSTASLARIFRERGVARTEAEKKPRSAWRRFRHLDEQPLAEDLAQLQAQVDAVDLVHDTQRPDQGFPGRVTPLTAWQTTPKADPPRPAPDRSMSSSRPVRPAGPPPASRPARAARSAPAEPRVDLAADAHVKTLTGYGTFMLDSVHHEVDEQHGYEQVLVVTDGDRVVVTDLHGEISIEHTRPETGVEHVGNRRPRGRRLLSGPATVTGVPTREPSPLS